MTSEQAGYPPSSWRCGCGRERHIMDERERHPVGAQPYIVAIGQCDNVRTGPDQGPAWAVDHGHGKCAPTILVRPVTQTRDQQLTIPWQ